MMYKRNLRPDELMHRSHKYIDKVRVRNGWRYIYDTVSGERAKRQMITNRRNYYTAKNQEKAYYDANRDKIHEPNPTGKVNDYFHKDYQNGKRTETNHSKYLRSQEKYNSHPVVIGRKIAASTVSGANALVKRGKSLFKKLFG